MARRGENIRKRTDGRWEGRYYAWDAEKGRKVCRSVYARSYGAVKKNLLDAKALCQAAPQRSGIEDAAVRMGLAQVAEDFLGRVREEKKRSTYVKYRQVYEKWLKPLFLELSTDDSCADALSRALRELPISSGSLRRSVYCVANQVLRHAHRHYGMACSVIPLERGQRMGKKVEILTPMEQARLLQVVFRELMDERVSYRLGVLLCLSTGLRCGEICSLRWEDIDVENGLLYVKRTVQRIAAEDGSAKTVLWEDAPKSQASKREIPLPDVILAIFRELGRDGKYVVSGGRPTEPRTFYNNFQRLLQEAGLPKARPHILRHTFATNSVNAGVDVKSLSEILGHSDVSVTLNRYVHPTMETKREHMNKVSAIYGQYMGQELVRSA